MQRPNRSDKAYAAGFFDGEGCVSLPKQGRRSHNIYLVVEISQKNLAPLLWLQDRWGGNLCHRPTGVTELVMTSGPGIRFLRDVLPFLQVKRAAALVAFQFQRLIGKEKCGRSHLLSPEAARQRQDLKAVLEELNRNNGEAAQAG